MQVSGIERLPLRKQNELERVVRILFDEFEDAQKGSLSEKHKNGRILKLILFGSYARGDWVEDRKSGYRSDYDLLVVVNTEIFAEQHEAWEKAAERKQQHRADIGMRAQTLHHALRIFVGEAAGEADQVHVLAAEIADDLAPDMVGSLYQIGDDHHVADALAAIGTQVAPELGCIVYFDFSSSDASMTCVLV